MAARLLGHLDAAQHTRDFCDPIAFGELLDAREGASLLDFLFNDVVGVGQRRDLRQMSHTDHLMVRGNLFEFLADDLRHPPADARVDFVDQGEALHLSRAL